MAGLSDNAHLLGTDNQSAALVEQWIDFADDMLFNSNAQLYIMFAHYLPYNKVYEQRAFSQIELGLQVLSDHLVKQTFLVGHRLTAADLAVASVVRAMYISMLGPEVRDKFPNVQRYIDTVVNQSAIKDVYPAEEYAAANAKYVPPKKEEKPKEQKPKEEKKPKAKAAAANEDDDEDVAPKEAKPKNPLDELPKSKFNLEEWKRVYSNEDTRAKALPWFYENFDWDGFSVWRFDFKYNDELTQVFMSANQIGGFFNRLEASRKYVMGTAGVFGKANDSVISGVIICRGKEYEPVLSVAPDLDSYKVTPLDLKNDADKKFFEDMMAWEAVVDGKEWADGKMLK